MTSIIASLTQRKDLLTEAGKVFNCGWGVYGVLDFALLSILTRSMPVFITRTSSIISFMSGTILNYYLCTIWIFKNRAIANRNLEIFYYFIITAVGLGINYLVIAWLTPHINNNYMAAKLAATFATYWWNFGARKYFLHSKTTLQPESVG